MSDPKINYTGNSHKIKEGKVASSGREKKVEKVISGEAVKRQKPLGRKVAETFAGDDVQTVGNYILFDVVLPAAKAMISDAASQGVERLLFGDSVRRPGTSAGRGAGHTSYNRMYQPGTARSTGNREISKRARANHEFDEVILGTRGEAEEVLERLSDLVDEYDSATVSDLYDLVGITGSFTDDKWGWTDLRTAGVSRVREGYLLSLPRTQPLD